MPAGGSDHVQTRGSAPSDPPDPRRTREAGRGSLGVAIAFEYERSDIAAAFELADRICAMTYRLAK